jgi:hypothetical protein
MSHARFSLLVSAVACALLLVAACGGSVTPTLSATPTHPPEQACVDSGGTVSTQLCCGSVGDFPNTCVTGACGCSPQGSHEVRVCNCGASRCFNGTQCVTR